MNKTPKLLLWALLAFAAPLTLSSCKDDEEDEFETLSPVAGEYVGAETCGGGAPHEYYVQIYNTSDNLGKVFIDNIYGLSDYSSSPEESFHVRFVANTNGNTITLPPTTQTYTDVFKDTYTVTVSANGQVDGDKVTLNFTFEGDLTGDGVAETDTCTFVGSRTYVGPAAP